MPDGRAASLFSCMGSDSMSQLQPVRMLQCEAKGHLSPSTCDFRHSYLQGISSHANCTTSWSLKDMAVSAHT